MLLSLSPYRNQKICRRRGILMVSTKKREFPETEAAPESEENKE